MSASTVGAAAVGFAVLAFELFAGALFAAGLPHADIHSDAAASKVTEISLFIVFLLEMC